MNSFSVILILFSMSYSAQNCQQEGIVKPNELIGIWQADNNEDGSAWPDVYRFFGNMEFIFNPNQYDGLKRILAIKGSYKIVGNKLYLRISSTTEIMGGHLTRSTITTLSDSWELKEGEIRNITQPDREEEIIEIQRNSTSSSKEISILLDGRKYYKMQNDPTKY